MDELDTGDDGGVGRDGFLVLANQGAGSVEPDGLFRATKVLADRAPTEIRFLHDDDLREVLAERDGRTVVIAGGDGTVHRVVGELLAADDRRPVGLLPLGTANDTARGLGLPLDPSEAAARVAYGRPRPVSVIEVETRDAPRPVSSLVINGVHLGAGARAAELATRLKPRLGRLAYPAATAVTGATARPLAGVTVTVDGTAMPLARAPLVLLVANGPAVGADETLLEGERPDDDRARVLAVPGGGPLERLGHAWSAVRGGLLARAGVTTASGRVVELERPQGLDVDVDGEPEPWGTWCRLTVRTAAWYVLDDTGGVRGA